MEEKEVEMVEGKDEVLEISREQRKRHPFVEGCCRACRALWFGTNTATKITMVRMLLIPFIIFFWVGAVHFYLNDFFAEWGRFVALMLFVIAVASDWLDGYVARKFNQVSDMGKLLDHVIDKLLVLAGFLLIITDPFLTGDEFLSIVPIWAAVVVAFVAIGRDVVVTTIRQLALQKGLTMGADKLGKAKTLFQFLALILFMIYVVNYDLNPGGSQANLFETILIYLAWSAMVVATALTVISAVNYGLQYGKLAQTNDKGE